MVAVVVEVVVVHNEHIPKQQLPNHFCAYFHDKVSRIRKELDNCVDEPSFDIFQREKLDHFHAVNSNTVKTIVMKSAPKSCSLDPIPSDLLQQHIDDIIDVMTNLINASLRVGVVPPAFKKASLDPNNLTSARFESPVHLKNPRTAILEQ